MDYLCELPNDAARGRALDTLPPTLNATYERILQRVNTSNKQVRQLVQRSLRWLVCTKIPIKGRALCEATSVYPGNTNLDRSAVPEEDDILRWCSSLVRKSVSGDWLELAHFTVKEYLIMNIDTSNPAYDLYHFDPESDDAELAETCLTYLSFRDFAIGETICQDTLYQRWKAFAFREHAVKFWMKYAREHLKKPNISALTRQLLHPSKPFIFISWAQDFLMAVFDFTNPDLTKVSPLHFAAALALPEICIWLLENGCNVDQRSAVGTPLECALAGKAALSGVENCAIPIETLPAELGGQRRSTVNIMIDNGADVQYGYLRSSPISIAIAMSDMVSCIDLLHKGAIIDEEASNWLFGLNKWDLSRGILENIDKNKIRHEDYATLLKAALMSKGFTANISRGGPTHELLDQETADLLYLEAFETAAAYGQFSVVQQLLHDYKLDINAVSVHNTLPALHKAVSNDHVEVVEYLIAHGADYSLTDFEGRTPLHYAVQGGSRCLPLLLDRKVDLDLGDLLGLTAWHLAASIHNLHAIKKLSQVTSNIQTVSRLKATDGRTPLHCAAQSGSRDTIAFFIDHGDRNTVRDTTSNGFTALHYAIEANSLEAVKYLVDNGANTQALTGDGSTTLHCALQHDDPAVFEIVELLLRQGVDPCKARGDGMTSFHVLIEHAHTAYAKHAAKKELHSLLNKLAQHASSLDSSDADGLTVLHHVCQLHDVDSLWDWRLVALETLLDNGADPSVEDRMGSTALMYVVECWKQQVLDPAKEDLNFGDVTLSSVAMIKKTLACIADTTSIATTCGEPHLLCLARMFREEALAYEALKYCSSVDSIAYQFSEMSPLEIACQYGCSRPLLAELLGKSSIDRGAAGSRTQLLHFACERNRSSLETTVANLLSLGFDSRDRTSEGKTALMFAAQAGNPAAVKNLIHHGADISASDKHGWTIVHYACEAGDLELLYLIKTLPIAWNTRIKAKLSTTWSRDATVLHLAASLDNCALGFLLGNQLVADLNCLTQRKDTPMYVAALWGISNNVSSLLDWSADAELVNSVSETPLHAASRLGHLDVVMTFIDKACKLELLDGSGFSPELLARKYGHVDIADILKERVSEEGKHDLARSLAQMLPQHL